jgi:hypothetical protein
MSESAGQAGSRHRSTTIWLLGVGALALVVVIAVVVVATTRSAGHGPITLWVSPTGSDANAGTSAAPFKTVTRAEQAVDHLGGANGGDVTVMLESGTYRLTKPLSITPANAGHGGSSVTWRSAPGQHAILSGARSVPSAAWSEVDPSLDIWGAHVGRVSTRQLWVDGVRATLARTASYPSGFDPTSPSASGAGGIRYVPTTLNDATWRDPATWTDLSGVDAVIYDQWKMAVLPVSSLVPATATEPGLLKMAEPAWANATAYRSATGGPAIWGVWQIAYFENAYQFLTTPGQWYLDTAKGELYYIPLPGQSMATADVELPVLQQLITGAGTPSSPINSIHFDDLTLEATTWLGPSGPNGYVSDQSGMLVTGTHNAPNVIGHATHVAPTPGSVELAYDHGAQFDDDVFRQMGSAALALGAGTQGAVVEQSAFSDVSGAGIELGGVSTVDARPPTAGSLTSSNTFDGDLLVHTGAEFVDTAAIVTGFTRATTIEHSTIADVPWSGISMGWGWGLLDPSGFPGLPGARRYEWGRFSTPTVNADSIIKDNLIEDFLQNRWDGGAIYTTGAQGSSAADGLLIEGNVATAKDPSTGGNVLYTDGGTRYVTIRGNVLFDNPIGTADFGPAPKAGDPLPYDALPSKADGLPYGSDTGGCVTYGQISYEGNFWFPSPMSTQIAANNAIYTSLGQHAPYSANGYFSPCPALVDGVSHPVDLVYTGNHTYTGQPQAAAIIAAAGATSRPPGVAHGEWPKPTS